MSLMNGVWHDAELDPPPKSGKYLVASSSGAVFTAHWYAASEYNKWQGHFSAGRRRPAPCGPVITHWMPLPKHPMMVTQSEKGMSAGTALERKESE